MQFSVPEVFDVTKESESTRELYGDSASSRRVVSSPAGSSRKACGWCSSPIRIDGYDIAWDTGHGDIVGGHAVLAKACDQGIAALLDRSEGTRPAGRHARRLGRRVRSRADLRRCHRPRSRSLRIHRLDGRRRREDPDYSHGATDEFGFSAVENRVHVHDLARDHPAPDGPRSRKLTYRYSGRDYRLTDVHGQVVHDIIA